MPTLEKFSLPGHLTEDLSADQAAQLADAWHAKVAAIFADRAGDFDQLYDPTTHATPPDHQVHAVTWHAFPATLNRKRASPQPRAKLADSRDVQDEYCEWSVQRDEQQRITKVTFTTEVPEYYEVLWQIDPNAVVALYRTHVSPDVQRDELSAPDGGYNKRNGWNTRINGPIMHLQQVNNTLGAAVTLATEATVQRTRNGTPVTGHQDLVRCGNLGAPLRNSDPQIAAAINGLAATGRLITLADPLGLYIDRLENAGIELPDGLTIDDCWKIERGQPGHALRASFALPGDNHTVSDVTINDEPIRFGGQLADRVIVRIRAVSLSPGSVTPTTAPCV
ncbi:MAG: hypothetical protein U5R31_16955 [Acidimicrobiia bacterium]|nr:hypothetical protein [Acidimicrobiia bacterium]